MSIAIAAGMTTHTLRTESLFRLTGPVFLQQITQWTVLLVDLWFFSRLGDSVAGTVGQLMPVVWIGAFVIPVFAGTGVSVASQFMGAQQHHRVVPAYMVNLVCTATMAALFAAFLLGSGEGVGRWMGLSAADNAVGATYLRAMSAYFIPMGVLVAYNAVLSSRGMTHWLMYSSFVNAGLNMALAALFVLRLGWGVRGVVAASVVSVTSAMAIAIWLVHAGLRVKFHLSGAWRDMLGVVRPMLRIGVSNAFEPFSYCVQQIVLSSMVIKLGDTAMAAGTYAARAQSFQIAFSLSLALGSQILLAHWMGARRFDDVDRLYWRAIRWGTAVAGIYAGALWLFSGQVLAIFTRDEGVQHLGATLLLVAVCYQPARAVNIIGGFSLKTVGDARFPLAVAIVCIWGILPVIYAIDHFWHLTLVGFWACFAADEIIRAGINLWRWRTGRWKSMGIAHPAGPITPPAVVLTADL
ncbi:MAG TPA: MATE family efflux transporter [Kofleriaceae bacterium]|nr:MATE family efflux transporter [Kofleriaceae bacterium]